MSMAATSTGMQPRRRWLAVPGLVLAAAVLGPALLSIAWTPSGLAPSAAPLGEPDAVTWLGADAQGRDLVSLLMAATLGTLVPAVLAGIASLMLGIGAGAAMAIRFGAGRLAPWPGTAMLPFALAIGVVLAALQSPANLTIILAIAIPGTLFVALWTRRLVAPEWQREFVLAARIAGLAPLSAAQRHVVPRLLPGSAAVALELLAAAIMVEIALSFAGLGTAAPGLSLGALLAEAQPFLMVRPLLGIAPGAVGVLLAAALLLAAAGLREARHGGA